MRSYGRIEPKDDIEVFIAQITEQRLIQEVFELAQSLDLDFPAHASATGGATDPSRRGKLAVDGFLLFAIRGDVLIVGVATILR